MHSSGQSKQSAHLKVIHVSYFQLVVWQPSLFSNGSQYFHVLVSGFQNREPDPISLNKCSSERNFHREFMSYYASIYIQIFLMFKLVLEKAEESEIKLPTSDGSSKSKRIPEKYLFLRY